MSYQQVSIFQCKWIDFPLYTLLTIFKILWAENTKAIQHQNPINSYAARQHILGFVSRLALYLYILFLTYGKLCPPRKCLKSLAAPKSMDRRDSMKLAGSVALHYFYPDYQHFRNIHNIHKSKTRLKLPLENDYDDQRHTTYECRCLGVGTLPSTRLISRWCTLNYFIIWML